VDASQSAKKAKIMWAEVRMNGSMAFSDILFLSRAVFFLFISFLIFWGAFPPLMVVEKRIE